MAAMDGSKLVTPLPSGDYGKSKKLPLFLFGCPFFDV
jgi:hypothetical protein